MHQIAEFHVQNFLNFSGEGQPPPETSSVGEMETLPTPDPSAPSPCQFALTFGPSDELCCLMGLLMPPKMLLQKMLQSDKVLHA